MRAIAIALLAVACSDDAEVEPEGCDGGPACTAQSLRSDDCPASSPVQILGGVVVPQGESRIIAEYAGCEEQGPDGLCPPECIAGIASISMCVSGAGAAVYDVRLKAATCPVGASFVQSYNYDDLIAGTVEIDCPDYGGPLLVCGLHLEYDPPQRTGTLRIKGCGCDGNYNILSWTEPAGLVCPSFD